MKSTICFITVGLFTAFQPYVTSFTTNGIIARNKIGTARIIKPSSLSSSSLLHPKPQQKQCYNTLQQLSMSKGVEDDKDRNFKFLLDPDTKGGALFLSLILFALPVILYNIITNFFGLDDIDTGKWIGVIFTVVISLGWVGTYIFRVATKDMTYAKQLKDYENAVIAKRLEELDDDEVQALVEEVERDAF